MSKILFAAFAALRDNGLELHFGSVKGSAMITYRILEGEGVVIIEPSGQITRSDLDALTRDVDTYIRQREMIRGMIIHTRSFPRWHDLGAFLKDMKFVFAHQRRIERVASVTDSRLLFFVHRIAHHVLSPEIGHFSYRDKEAALHWIREKRPQGGQRR